MMPQYKPDYVYADSLSEILKHPRLRDKKYGSPNYREVVISRLPNGLSDPFRASAMFLKLLLEKFGDVSFGDALDKWRREKCAR